MNHPTVAQLETFARLARLGNYTRVMARRIRAGELVLALIEGPLDDPGLDIAPFMDDRLCLVVPTWHRFAQRDQIDPAELVEEQFVWREAGSGTRAIAESALASASIHPPVALALLSGEGVARAVEAGLGVTILSWLKASLAQPPIRQPCPSTRRLSVHGAEQ